MTLYLTDKTSAAMIQEAHKQGDVYACKLYPASATTHSDSGVTDLKNVYGALEAMTECGLPLLVHGEVTDSDIDIFDREKVFIDRHLTGMSKRFPNLKIVMEHITTADDAQFELRLMVGLEFKKNNSLRSATAGCITLMPTLNTLTKVWIF